MADLSDSIETIIDSVVDAVKAEMGGGTLSDVKTVIRGDRARPMPEMPAVWIVPQAAQQRAETYGEETWELPLSIAALVKGADPAEAGKAAQRITSLARSAALKAEPQMEIGTGDVTMIASTSFDPTARSSETNRNLFWCEATVTVIFTVIE